MTSIRVRSLIAAFLIALGFPVQISVALAGSPPHPQLATQGSRVPGFPPPTTNTTNNREHRRVDITYTKWVTTFPLMAGFTDGDVTGLFVGEVLQRQVSLNGRIIRLEAIYEVQAGEHSFTALVRGGTGETKAGEPASVSGAALLDGVILAGWRTGSRVHAEFQTTTPSSTTEVGCPGAPAGKTCFQGTIHIERDSEE